MEVDKTTSSSYSKQPEQKTDMQGIFSITVDVCQVYCTTEYTNLSLNPVKHDRFSVSSAEQEPGSTFLTPYVQHLELHLL